LDPAPAFALHDFVRLSAGPSHVLAIRSDGSLWSWGTNDDGQLGDPFRSGNEPRRVPGVGPVLFAAAGSAHSLFR
jgi:hypothetical protein